MFFIPMRDSRYGLGSKQKCALCNEQVGFRFNPMSEWGVDGVICGKCYSRKIDEHYPGDHVRVNKEGD